MLKRLQSLTERVRLSDFLAFMAVPGSVAVGSLVWLFTGDQPQGAQWTGMSLLTFLTLAFVASGRGD